MMPLPNFSWLLPNQVAGCARPSGPEAMAQLARAGVRRLMTLTEEPLPAHWHENAAIEGLHLPVADFAAPTQEQLRLAVEVIEASLAAGAPIAVHCAAGLGRTGTILAALLVRRGSAPADAIAEVRRRRPGSIETPAQAAAVHAYAASIPGGTAMAAFDREIVDLAMGEREVDLTTYGRKTGKESRRTIWVWGDGQRLYVRSGQGIGRDWPQNLLANGRAVLHVAGRDVPMRVRHVTDPAETRAGAAMVHAKYASGTKASAEGEPLTPGEQATFELLPE